MAILAAAAIIVLTTSVRAISFSIWQFQNKNIIGGIMVALLAVSASAIIIYNLI